jgi:hypothetical protein
MRPEIEPAAGPADDEIDDVARALLAISGRMAW